MFLLWLRQLPPAGSGPLLQCPHLRRVGPVLLTLLFFPLVPSSYRVLRDSIYSFLWSGTPVRSELVFCMHFCVWRCVTDVSMERDVLHINLLLHHLRMSLILLLLPLLLMSNPKKILPIWILKEIFPMFYFRSFMVLSLMFKSLMHFELIFEYGLR